MQEIFLVEKNYKLNVIGAIIHTAVSQIYSIFVNSHGVSEDSTMLGGKAVSNRA